MIPIKCNGCGQELKDTRGFKSHCIKKHEGQDPGFTRIGQEVKQDESEDREVLQPEPEPEPASTKEAPEQPIKEADPVSTVRIITGADKQDKAWMDDIIKQVATPENIALAVAAGVALLSGIVDKHTGNKPAQAGAGLTDLYGNVHEF